MEHFSLELPKLKQKDVAGLLTDMHCKGHHSLCCPYASRFTLFNKDHIACLDFNLLSCYGHYPFAAYNIENTRTARMGWYLLSRLHAYKGYLVSRPHS